jgi:glycosyltransferase involved in cell wall biosynthesis
MMTMRVLIYTHAFIPKVGGVETYVMHLATGLSERGCTVTVATPTSADGFDDRKLSFHVVRQPGVRALWRLLREVDIVQVAGPCFVPLLLGLLLRKLIVIEHHGYQAVCPNGLLLYESTKTLCPGHFMAQRYHKCLHCNAHTNGWFKSFLMLLLTFPRRWLCKCVAVNVRVTNHVSQRVALPRTRTIYYGIPDPIVNPLETRTSQSAIRDPFTFAYVGRLVSEKGLPLLLEAAKRLKDQGYNFRLKLIGDGPERPRLEAMTDALSLREEVFFAGFLRGKALQEALEDVAAVAMPSVWEETAGLAAMEQMMRGRIVIASDIGGLGEVVGDAGLKFPAGHREALVRCLLQVLENPNLVNKLGEKARARALALFQQGRMANDHLRLYRGLLKSLESAPSC